MKICINDIFGAQNRGDALLCDALITSIKEAFPNATLTGIAHFPELEASRHPQVDWQEAPGRSRAQSLLMRRLVNAFRLSATILYSWTNGSTLFKVLIPLPKSQLKAIDHIRDADLIVSSAGGFLLDANPTIFIHLLQFYLSQKFNKPYILAPQTIGPIDSPRLRRWTAAAINKAQLIAVRERYSYDFVVDTLKIPREKVVKTTDIAFEHTLVDRSGGAAALSQLGFGEHEQFIGATTVNWAFRNTPNPKQSYEAYRDKFILLFQRLHQQTGMRILLFNQVSQDLPLARYIAQNCGDAVVIDEEDRTTEVMRGMIERSTVMVGSRFHSCIFSLLGRVPLYCIAYTYKSTGIMEDLGLLHLLTDIQTFNVDETVDAVTSLIENRGQEIERVNDAVNSLEFPKFSNILQDYEK